MRKHTVKILIYTLVYVCAFKYVPKETQGAQWDVRVSVERHTILVSSSPRPASETLYNPIVLTDFQIAEH